LPKETNEQTQDHRWPLSERKTTEVISTIKTKMRSIDVDNENIETPLKFMEFNQEVGRDV